MHRNFFNTLSPDQQAVFRLYKNNSEFDSAGYFADQLNSLLRLGTPLTDPWQSANASLESIIAKWHQLDEVTVYRATFDDFVKPYVAGDSLKYPAYLSTAVDCEKIQRHWANSWPGRTPVMLVIHCLAGSPVAPFDSDTTLPESEYLIKRGQSLRIINRCENSRQEKNDLMGFYSKGYDHLMSYELELAADTLAD